MVFGVHGLCSLLAPLTGGFQFQYHPATGFLANTSGYPATP